MRTETIEIKTLSGHTYKLPYEGQQLLELTLSVRWTDPSSGYAQGSDRKMCVVHVERSMMEKYGMLPPQELKKEQVTHTAEDMIRQLLLRLGVKFAE